ncbi:MAG: hypothetical protein ACI4NO_06610, partial [Oxalobacter sp.]
QLAGVLAGFFLLVSEWEGNNVGKSDTLDILCFLQPNLIGKRIYFWLLSCNNGQAVMAGLRRVCHHGFQAMDNRFPAQWGCGTG